MTDFHQTKGGHEFYYGTMPKIARALERIADSLEAIAKTMEEKHVPRRDEDRGGSKEAGR
jgi:hypothetical protein